VASASLGYQYREAVVIVFADLDIAGFEPSLDKSCGGDEVVGPGGVVTDQSLRQVSLIDHAANKVRRLG
jgi:hypothetical protein